MSRFTRVTEVISPASIDCVAGWVYAMSVPARDTAGVSTMLVVLVLVLVLVPVPVPVSVSV